LKGEVMKLKEFKFRELPKLCGLSIFDGDKELASGFIGEVLEKLPIKYAEREIKSTNWYFDTFVIRL
jgi:hypothetical protein